jgi:hypothetical protein
MKTAAEHRAMADECWAGETHDYAVRAGYLGLAQVWLDAAAKLDGLPVEADSARRQTFGYARERPAKRRGPESQRVGCNHCQHLPPAGPALMPHDWGSQSAPAFEPLDHFLPPLLRGGLWRDPASSWLIRSSLSTTRHFVNEISLLTLLAN